MLSIYITFPKVGIVRRHAYTMSRFAPSLFPDRFTVLRINATFQKVGAVSGDTPPA